MEQVHKFIKKQNVSNYRAMGFECFKLLSSHTDLENAKEDLADLEEEEENYQ